MKWLIYGAVIAAALLVPVERTDVGKLQPIEAVAIYIEDNQIIMETELGDMGAGQTVTEALENLKQTTAGIVYLDTAEYLLIGPAAQEHIPNVDVYLKDNVRVCRVEEDPDLQKAVRYLDVHRPLLKISQWDSVSSLETLTMENGRFCLLKKD